MPKKSQGRSRVSNRSDILAGVDQRSAIARRYRDLVIAVGNDQGGLEHLSETRLQLIRRLSGASVLAEQLEARMAAGEQIQITEYSTLASTIVRIAQRIGIDRIARDVIPELKQYIDQTYVGANQVAPVRSDVPVTLEPDEDEPDEEGLEDACEDGELGVCQPSSQNASAGLPEASAPLTKALDEGNPPMTEG
jgi:hypothetical protein